MNLGRNSAYDCNTQTPLRSGWPSGNGFLRNNLTTVGARNVRWSVSWQGFQMKIPRS